MSWSPRCPKARHLGQPWSWWNERCGTRATRQVDSGGTAKYTYNALNQRVRIDAGGAGAEYVFNPSGQRASAWNITGAQFQGQTYWGTAPVEFYASAVAHFQHQDWLGTERLRTTYNGGVEGTFSSLPFGDGYSVSGADDDGYHFAGMDQDSASNDHAQFRQYSNMAGSWMSPDPYRGSYDPTNPQSMNRYAYVMNNALAYTDPSGLYLAENCKGGCWGSGNPSGGLANEFTWMDIEQGIYANQSWTAPNSGITTNAPNIYKGPDGNWYAQEPDGSTTNLGSLLFNGSGSGSLSGSSSSTIGYFGNVSLGVPSAGGQNVIAAGAPNNGQSYSFVKQWWKDVKNCVGNVALPTIANDLNPLSIGIGTGADIASQMSQASLAGAASWSVSRGLTVPLRSSIVRAGVASAETLGEVSGVLTMASVVYALGDAVVAEYNQCQ